MTKEKVTLTIPTYKRPSSLRKLLERLAASNKMRQIFKILIVNDSGDDCNKKIYEELIHTILIKYKIDVEIHHNDDNIGLPLSFTKLIELVETSYFLYIADDDLLLEKDLENILYFIQKQQPSLVSARWLYRNARIGRGINSTRKMKIDEFRLASGHLSGIFFKTDQMKEFTRMVRQEIENSNAAALTYPGVFYHIPIIFKYDNSWWFDADIVEEGDGMPSGIKDNSGVGYNAISSRIQQIAGFDSYILQLEDSPKRKLMLLESRAWGIKKAVSADLKLKNRLLKLLKPSILDKIRGKINQSLINTK